MQELRRKIRAAGPREGLPLRLTDEDAQSAAPWRSAPRTVSEAAWIDGDGSRSGAGGEPQDAHDTGSINSSGVQIIGDTSPARRHVSSIFPRMAALARCRRFQVTRKSTPLTAGIATCAASTRAVDGKAPLRRSERTSAPARGPAAKIGMLSSALMRRAAAAGSPRRASASRSDGELPLCGE